MTDEPLTPVEKEVPLTEKEAAFIMESIGELHNIWMSSGELPDDVAEDIPRSSVYYIDEIVRLLRDFSAI